MLSEILHTSRYETDHWSSVPFIHQSTSTRQKSKRRSSLKTHGGKPTARKGSRYITTFVAKPTVDTDTKTVSILPIHVEIAGHGIQYRSTEILCMRNEPIGIDREEFGYPTVTFEKLTSLLHPPSHLALKALALLFAMVRKTFLQNQMLDHRCSPKLCSGNILSSSSPSASALRHQYKLYIEICIASLPQHAQQRSFSHVQNYS